MKNTLMTILFNWFRNCTKALKASSVLSSHMEGLEITLLWCRGFPVQKLCVRPAI